MLTAVVGPPGSGKTYEVVNFEILPALRRGRRVYTNVAMEWDLLEEEGLGSLCVEDLPPKVDGASVPVDAIREWWGNGIDGEPAKFEVGSLVVYDELHRCLPTGAKQNEYPQWRDFFAMHRHAGVDVIMILQNHAQVPAWVRNQVERSKFCVPKRYLGKLWEDAYFVRACEGFPSRSGREVARVADYTDSRRRNKEGFRFYRSRTLLSNEAAEEAAKHSENADGRSFWKRVVLYLVLPAVLLTVIMGWFLSGGMVSMLVGDDGAAESESDGADADGSAGGESATGSGVGGQTFERHENMASRRVDDMTLTEVVLDMAEDVWLSGGIRWLNVGRSRLLGYHVWDKRQDVLFSLENGAEGRMDYVVFGNDFVWINECAAMLRDRLLACKESGDENAESEPDFGFGSDGGDDA